MDKLYEKGLENAIKHDILRNISLFIMIFNVITFIFSQVNMIFIKSKTISYILCGIFIAIFIGVVAILIWSVVLSKEDDKLFDSINKSLLQELDDNNE